MDEYCCEICFLDFDEQETVPKMLDCGHSFCAPCIAILASGVKQCPKCKRQMPKKKGVNYPKNYSLLNVMDSIKKMQLNQPFLKDLHFLQNKLRERRTEINDQIETKFMDLDTVTTALLRINDILERGNSQPTSKETETWINEMLKQFKDYNSKNSDIKEEQNQDKVPVIQLCDFNTSECFLKKIESVLYGGKEVFVSTVQDDFVMYGRTSICNEMLFIHAFCSTEPPPTATIVKYVDLRASITKHNFRAFLRFPFTEGGAAHTVLVRLLDSTLTEGFVRLCTGENGPTYKAAPFHRGFCGESPGDDGASESLVVVEFPRRPEEKALEYHTSELPSFERRNYGASSILVERLEWGGFRIFRSPLDDLHLYERVVGRVVSNQKFVQQLFYGGNARLLDSGVAFHLRNSVHT